MVPFQLSYSTHSVHDGSYAIQGCRGCQQQNLVGETKMLSCGPTSRTTYRDVTIRLTPRKSRMPIERKLGYGFVLKRRRASGGTRELQEMQLRKLSSTKTTERKLFSSLLVWWVAVNGKKKANEEKLPIRERELCLKTHFPFDQTHTPLVVETETTQKCETGEGYVRPRTSRVIFREIKTIRTLSPRLHDWAFTFQRRHLHF